MLQKSLSEIEVRGPGGYLQYQFSVEKNISIIFLLYMIEKENLQKRFEDLENEKFDVDTEKRKLEYLHKALLKKHQIMERAFRKNEAKVGDVPKEVYL